MDDTICARILWATTARLSTATGNAPVLADARAALARILWSGCTTGFAAPAEPSPTERQSAAWLACVDAALAGKAPGAGVAPAYALLWAGDAAATPPAKPAAGHGLSWPEAAGTTLDRAIGPLKDSAGEDVWLFLYSAIDARQALEKDGDTGCGLFPRAGRAGSRASGTVPAARRSGAWAWVLFVVSILLGAFAIVWVYAASDLARGAARAVVAGTSSGEAAIPGSQACLSALRSYAANPAAPLDRAACDQSWSTAWAQQKPKISRDSDWWDKTLDWLWEPLDQRAQLSLLWPLLMSALAILLLVLSAGIARKNYFLGALIDERNRISLSRLQQLGWTVVLFAGITSLGVFNMALLAGYVRELAQNAALQDATGTAATTVQMFSGFFPSMDPTLWAVLGITVLVSPYLSRRILAAKEVKAGDTDWQAVQARTVPPDPLEQRASPAQANWADLVTGEGEANADRVDVSRLQHLVITGLLLSGYIVLLVEYVRAIDGTSILLASLSGAPVFAAMPPVDATFVGLLALSHTGYLAFKALPAQASGNPT